MKTWNLFRLTGKSKVSLTKPSQFLSIVLVLQITTLQELRLSVEELWDQTGAQASLFVGSAAKNQLKDMFMW